MNNKYGFTLLEILISSLIFTIVILAVLGTYSMLMTNYRDARHYIEGTGRAFNIFTHFRDNLVNVYPEYENKQEEMMDTLFRRIEADYNVPRSEVDENFIWDLQDSHRYEDESVYGFANQNFGDFSFVVGSHKNNSLLSFTVYNKATTTPLDLGLHRLSYFVDEGILYRYTHKVFLPFREAVKKHFRQASELERGALIPVSDGILDFQVKAHYYRDYEFHQTDTWDSDAHKHVFPPLPEEEMLDLIPEDESILFPARDGHPIGLTISIRVALSPNDEQGRLYSMYYDIPVSISSWYEDEYRYEHLYETPYR